MIKKFIVLCLILICITNVVVIAAQDSSEPVTVVDAFGNEVVIEDASRIVTIGGAVTEVAFALGVGDRIIAVDDSSIYPEEATGLESIGYLRFLTAEPILAVDPTLVIATEDAGPAEVVQQLNDSGITFLQVPAEDTVDGTAAKIRTIAAALDKVDEGEALVEDMLINVDTANNLVADLETTPRVMFLFLRGAAVITVSGTGSGADEMIRLAGAENAVQDYEGYQPLTAEAVVAAAPDVILTTTEGLESVGGMEGLLELPGIALTPAAENNRIFASMDDLLLLGFTPRLGEAVLDLTYQLHDELVPPIITVLQMSGDFETFLQGIDIASQQALLSSDGPFTIFAPNDDAFAKIPPDTLASLYSSPISVGFVFSDHYVFQQALSSDDLRAMAGEELQTMYIAGKLAISVDDDGTILLDDTIRVIQTDIPASNGVIHVIDTVIIPERPR